MSTNQDIVDASIGHQVDLQFYANGVVRESVGALNEDDDTLFALLLAALLSLRPNASPEEIDRALTRQVAAANAHTYSQIEAALLQTLLDSTQAEIEFQKSLVGGTAPSAGTVFAAAIAVPIIGATLRDTMKGLAANRFAAIRRAAQAGFVAQQSPDEIVRALRGTKSASFSDGLLNVSRTHLETVVRTAIGHVVEYSAAAFRALNPNIIRSVVWLSVLDTATSSWCIARAGKRYTADEAHRPIGHSYGWGAGPGRYHYKCRSTSAPLVAGEIPNANTYANWLSRQSAARQDEVLGPARGAMYRRGQVSVEGFLNNRGRLLTLDELRARRLGRAP